MRAGHYAKLTVRDTGTGIAPDVMDKIFDPFFTTKHTARGQVSAFRLFTAS
jgi:C4-dicarboxylate-specific signal transduction histidine kinase